MRRIWPVIVVTSSSHRLDDAHHRDATNFDSADVSTRLLSSSSEGYVPRINPDYEQDQPNLTQQG
jgi:hypothetical protein